MTTRSRKRRAAPRDIYPSCKLANTCPPDIVDSIENNTLADKILKYGSAGVFFGSLGIGTGRGTGGSTGYIPLGEGAGVRLNTRVSTVRPSLPISSVHPTDVIPVDAVDPLGPAIVPLSELPSIVEDPDPILPPRFPTAVEESVIDFSPAGPGGDLPIQSPKVTTTDTSALIEVTPETRPPRIISRSQYSNPSFEVHITSTSGSGESSAVDHVLIDGYSGGEVIGEEIPLIDLQSTRSSNTFSTTEVRETSFFTSTPRGELPSARPRTLYNRRVQQVQVVDPAFLSRPGALVTFDNPAYTDDVELIFEQDLDDLARAAPHEDFRDIVSLGRPVYGRNPQGGVRISRLGQKATMRTRSGLRIGPQSHFFYDISEIAEPELELVPLEPPFVGEQTGESVVGSALGEFETISLSNEPAIYPEDTLIDEYEVVGSDLQLIIGDSGGERPIPVADFARPPAKLFPELDGVQVINGRDVSRSATVPVIPEDTPLIIIEVLDGSGDYFLHPSLFRKRRKRPFF
ncbi:L2 [Procyon lotor papillomavirus 1]|uniref:Minor capsid protein L2 n=1 Tax=Procyon lotor papillomavirus 1 TaxID=312349 RepID=Q4QVZ9_9PAPI|nr:L2 [Procyon lotor papillomavirus 1]AAW88326.1 L2 [Procyon lotor papillomavirus 1]